MALDTHYSRSLQELSAHFLSRPPTRFQDKSWVCIFKTLRFCHFLPWIYPELFIDELKNKGESRRLMKAVPLLQALLTGDEIREEEEAGLGAGEEGQI